MANIGDLIFGVGRGLTGTRGKGTLDENLRRQLDLIQPGTADLAASSLSPRVSGLQNFFSFGAAGRKAQARNREIQSNLASSIVEHRGKMKAFEEKTQLDISAAKLNAQNSLLLQDDKQEHELKLLKIKQVSDQATAAINAIKDQKDSLTAAIQGRIDAQNEILKREDIQAHDIQLENIKNRAATATATAKAAQTRKEAIFSSAADIAKAKGVPLTPQNMEAIRQLNFDLEQAQKNINLQQITAGAGAITETFEAQAGRSEALLKRAQAEETLVSPELLQESVIGPLRRELGAGQVSTDPFGTRTRNVAPTTETLQIPTEFGGVREEEINIPGFTQETRSFEGKDVLAIPREAPAFELPETPPTERGGGGRVSLGFGGQIPSPDPGTGLFQALQQAGQVIEGTPGDFQLPQDPEKRRALIQRLVQELSQSSNIGETFQLSR
ncbi:MAG: hypothetical protein V3T23_06205 [Nitrososphaerales archaeon]